MDDRTDPASRAAYLASLDEQTYRTGGLAQPRDDGMYSRIADAERLVAQTEADWEAATQATGSARAALPGWELAHARYLNPEDRHAWVELQQAEEGLRQAEQAYTSARHQLNRLLAELEQLDHPTWGFPPPQV